MMNTRWTVGALSALVLGTTGAQAAGVDAAANLVEAEAAECDMGAAGGAEVGDAAALPERPVWPSNVVNYSGNYRFVYLGLMGEVEACVTVGLERTCEPLLIDIPLTEGQATVESLSFILEYLNSELEAMAPNLPAQLYPSYELLVSSLFPLLVTELNGVIAELPQSMELIQAPASPMIMGQVAVKGVPMTLPGQISVKNGSFALLQDLITGQIDQRASFQGSGMEQVPLHVSESVGMTTPTGTTSTVGLSLTGILGADLWMGRN